MSHYLAIEEESYDKSTIYGIFDTFNDARDYLEADAPDYPYPVSGSAEIQEWNGSKHVNSWERSYNAPQIWEPRWKTTS